ncbi:MAG: type II toxin-antitoxin system RelE/ParE family toxin [Paludibacteraceae bacterium]|nr:type II toxin-antitoxin system RelE/ParE family toxin [Paludibacteraceae bacterium]
MNDRQFKLVFSEEADKFLTSLPQKTREKIEYNIRRVQLGEMDSELFKKLEGSTIWEFRTLYNKIAYRLFAFWDTEEETLVIATHGFVKKSQKTPQKEIAKAENMRKEYFESKKEGL